MRPCAVFFTIYEISVQPCYNDIDIIVKSYKIGEHHKNHYLGNNDIRQRPELFQFLFITSTRKVERINAIFIIVIEKPSKPNV